MPEANTTGDMKKVFPQATNQKMRIQAQALVWVTMGSGEFSEISPTKISFNGKTDQFLWIPPQKFDISVELTDASRCKITINGTTSQGNYEQSGNKMSISISAGDRTDTLKMEEGSGGTYLNADIPNIPKNRIWIGK